MAVRAAIYRKKSNPLKGKVRLLITKILKLCHIISLNVAKSFRRVSAVYPRKISVNWQPPSNAHVIWGYYHLFAITWGNIELLGIFGWLTLT